MRSLPSRLFAVLAAVAAWSGASAAGVALHAGDLVMVDSYPNPQPDRGLWRLDPATLDTTRIATGGLLVQPDRIAVDRAGLVYVVDHLSGIVAIEPTTGGQSVLVPVSGFGGGVPHGICLADDGGLLVTLVGAGSGTLVHVSQGTRAVEVVSQGGFLVYPACVTTAPDGMLYVGDLGANIFSATGSIVRIGPGGAQSVFATGVPLRRPFDITVSPDGWIWTAQWGALSRRGGGFIRTRLSDGTSELMGGDRSQGLVAGGASLFLGDCESISGDCYPAYRYVYTDPSRGPRQGMPSGAMAVVPAMTTPAHRSTWGSLKTLYR